MINPIPGDSTVQVTIFPSPRLRTLYNIYLLVVVWCLVVPGLLIVIGFIDPVTMIVVSIGVLIIALAAIALIRKSSESLVYILAETTLEIQGGLGNWGRLTIPYAKIRSADIIRRVLPSYFGIASIRITYTTDSGKTATEDMVGIDHPEDVRSQILDRAGKEPSNAGN